jgi:hypothetical protein
VYNAFPTPDIAEKVTRITHRDYVLKEIGKDGLRLKRTYSPSVDKPMAVEKLVFINGSKQAVKIEMDI